MTIHDPEASSLDRYVVIEYLAEGGMGAIYLGKKLGAGGFEKQVVLKQLLPEFTRQPEFIDLFLREARLSASLDHANIIHTIDLVTAGEDYFIVMEYLDGADLRTLLKLAKLRGKSLSPSAALYIGRELLSALAYAHNKLGPNGKPLRLIHRDISPSNILISASGEVKLTDFGIAKASTHNSVFYRVKGKVGYMSPEQANSENLDARSDLYSLAVCLYEMITSERLFVNAGLTTSAEEMYSQPIPLVSRKTDGLPADIDKLMLRALAIDPGARFQTAGAFQDSLLRCAHKHGLMMSAPELADHLRDICGAPSGWRHADAARVQNPIDARSEGTEQIDMGEYSDDQLRNLDLGEHSHPGHPPTKSSVTRLTELKGIELTSMINVADEAAEQQSGAQPLIDFDNLAGKVHLDGEAGGLSDDPYADDDDVPAQPAAAAPEPIVPLSTDLVRDGGPDALPPPSFFGQGRRLLILSLILVLGVGTATVIGFTGPTLPDTPIADATQ